MPVGGSQVTCEADCANHNQNYRPGVPEVEVSATHLVEEEQDANGDDNRRAHEAANHAALAIATSTHQMFTLISLRTTVQPTAQHENAYTY